MTDIVNHPLPSKTEFMGWVDTRTNTGCWEWSLSRSTKRGGYGQKRLSDGKVCKAHRLAWMIFKGPIRPGEFVCHRCDNPPCCNPDHLFLGSPRDNVLDAISKGRAFVPMSEPGEKNPSAKLRTIDVIEARRLVKAGHSLRVVAEKFGVTKQAIWRIKKGQTWATI